MTPAANNPFTCGYPRFSLRAVYFTRPTLRRLMGALEVERSSAFWNRCDPRRQCIRNVVGANFMDAGLCVAFLPRFRHLDLTSLSRDIGVLMTVRLAWTRGFIGAVAVIGPPRDYMCATLFPGGWYSLGVLAPSCGRFSVYRHCSRRTRCYVAYRRAGDRESGLRDQPPSKITE